MQTALPGWPHWPLATKATLDAARVALMAGRWAISGPTTAFPLYEKAFAEEFAPFIGKKFCVPTANGSSAILIALQALGVGPGDKVLLPATTWVGCATAILRVGATPVFVDTNLSSLCMDLESLSGLDTATIAAVLAIHTYASRADVDRIRQRLPGIPIIEDCSHCHGAKLPDGRSHGSSGDISVFSFQASKTLTCGEGGAALTDDQSVYDAMLSLRADSRRYRQVSPPSSAISIGPAASLHGANYCLSELHASILLQQLELLETQNNLRAQRLKVLADELRDAPIQMVYDETATEDGAFYGVPIRLSRSLLERRGIEFTLNTLYERCGLLCDRIYPPIPESPLYAPETVSLYRKALSDTPRRVYPNAAEAHSSMIFVPHSAFLAESSLLRHFSDVLLSLEDGGHHSKPALHTSNEKNRYGEITAIVLSYNRCDSLVRTLNSILTQDYPGRIQVLVVGDNAPYVESANTKHEFSSLNIQSINLTGTLFQGVPTLERIARIRNLALTLVDSELVTFLDDDNRWEPNHLRSLYETMLKTGCPAVHSWRVLVDSSDRPCVIESFPWLPEEMRARERFEILVKLGLLSTESPIVRDRYEGIYNGVDYGMVDCGEWLFSRALLQTLGFQTHFSAKDIASMVGEDDKLLRELKKRKVPVACTMIPTLHYTLGGISNPRKERD